MKNNWIISGVVIIIAAGAGVLLLYRGALITNERSRQVMAFIRNPSSRESLKISAGTSCGEAPFIMPSTGMIGFIWRDSFCVGHHHTGIDIFSGTGSGVTPVVAAYDGYLTRLEDWKSTLIIRVPSDPLNSGEQIWTYYTHLADPKGESFIVDDFPPGTREIFVPAGTMLGYQGNYSGTNGNPTGVHLHFSIVKDDGSGTFMNELDIDNTLDPSPYFGMSLNADVNKDEIPICKAN